ncbi:hypothetical protein FJTKL_08350 [Diaporthe vaccinii]|uniref:Uncharacterized protein n=1 Tax=Diaporthe vaccinii TaxID=105482 RepID=A0ABR4ERP7_9PEZI
MLVSILREDSRVCKSAYIYGVPTLGTLQTFPLSNKSNAEVWHNTNNFESLFTRHSIHSILLPFDRAGIDTNQTTRSCIALRVS